MDKKLIKLILIISIIPIFFSGCATVDENVPKEKGIGNTIVWGALIVGMAAFGNEVLK
ncbi:hypothetical protein KKC59_03110 [bacterium]|nr:hypothetical protein [bacterium]